MAVAGNADPMLGYLTTSFREHPRLRSVSRGRITSAMSDRLATLGVPVDGDAGAHATASLYAAYLKAGGDRRTTDALHAEGAAKIENLRARGYDVGCGHGAGHAAPAVVTRRLETIYAQARHALYATLDDGVLQDVAPHHVSVRTPSRDRDDYLAHPRSGESLRDDDAERLASVIASGGSRRPQVQVVISDGLNANAMNENLRAVLSPLRGEFAAAGVQVGKTDVVIRNGRVRAGYHVGALVDADAIVHLIGERPGTGFDTLSAYLTYGRDAARRSRWGSDLDHAATTAVCGVHREGKPPAEAVAEITRLVVRILETRRSGVTL
jgi:ethanolamine ammonia-lyase large subunit